MANISRNTFDKLKHYVNVRMQQGVPLVDADWNEKDDIRKDELQLFLKWFIGNGIPKGNDGFHILPQPGEENDLLIKGGAADQPGICLVEGWDVRNETDIAYTAQSLYNDNDLAQEWDVTPLSPLTLPGSGERTDLVYLDAWEREVNAVEDPGLVHPAINIETCVRLKREWVVRVAEGETELPSPVPAGHVFYALATLKRPAGQPVIAQADITDLRTHIGSDLDKLNEAFTVLDGNVAIGKTTAAEKLEVNGRIKDQTGYVMPAGGIIMWSGAETDIPEGWVLCDGTNGTPDLRNKFIVGAGVESQYYQAGTTGGQASIQLTVEQMPSHTHGASQAEHNHNNGEFNRLMRVTGYNTPDSGVDNVNQEIDLYAHGIIQPAQPEITLTNTGEGEPFDIIPPYYALCFLMKL